MQRLDGVVTLVQEGRFLLRSDAGPHHVFILSHAAAAESDQIPILQRDQARVRIRFKPGRDVIAMVAHRVERLPAGAARG